MISFLLRLKVVEFAILAFFTISNIPNLCYFQPLGLISGVSLLVLILALASRHTTTVSLLKWIPYTRFSDSIYLYCAQYALVIQRLWSQRQVNSYLIEGRKFVGQSQYRGAILDFPDNFAAQISFISKLNKYSER